MPAYRIEKDSLGKKSVPSKAYYGIFTQRAFENFQISGIKVREELIHALVTVKIAAAQANMKLKVLSKRKGSAIVRAGKEILAEGKKLKPGKGIFELEINLKNKKKISNLKFANAFPLDIIQAGAGTPCNMNVNEVIANRANELLGKRKGSYAIVHPNDDVNLGQSSNDVIPTAVRIASLWRVEKLNESLKLFENELRGKAKEFGKVGKSARTHLQDAVPITLGQEFSGYAEAVRKSRQRIDESLENLQELGIGGTAAGTGLNSHPRYQGEVVKNLRKLTGLKLKAGKNLFEKMQSGTDFLEFANALGEYAVELCRIGNDFRLLASGPHTGFNELILPEVEPGSSIMPGKVNPSMAEMVNIACYHVLGNVEAVKLCSLAGQLELNVMTPGIAHNVLESIEILANATKEFSKRCVKGAKANKMATDYYLNYSFGLATVVAPLIGYEKAAELVKEASKSGKRIVDLILEKRILKEKQLEKVLKLENITKPNLHLIRKFKKKL